MREARLILPRKAWCLICILPIGLPTERLGCSERNPYECLLNEKRISEFSEAQLKLCSMGWHARAAVKWNDKALS
jgi:hypothetical protein